MSFDDKLPVPCNDSHDVNKFIKLINKIHRLEQKLTAEKLRSEKRLKLYLEMRERYFATTQRADKYYFEYWKKVYESKSWIRKLLGI